MEDLDLAAIRAKRMAELKGAHGSSQPQNQEGQEEKAAAQEEMRRNMIAQILDNEARERLNRISIVKPEKARAVEELIIRMARTGQIRGKVNEKTLVELLEQLREQTSSVASKVVINRRRFDESDSDEYDL